MELSFFNINDGFTEAIARGFRSGFLTSDDYRRLTQCETLEDLRTALDDTDYGSFMQDEPSPLEAATIARKAKAKLADDFKFLRAQAVSPMDKFLDFISAEKMINNVVFLIQGTLNNKPRKELLESPELDPLGWFEEMKTIMATLDSGEGYRDLYQTILIDTPVGPYFEEFLQSMASEEGGGTDVNAVLTATDLEIMKNILKKAWLEDFHSFAMSLGGTTAEVMGHMLKMEADFRVLLVTMNALNTPLGQAQQKHNRDALYPNFGYMFPEGAQKIRGAFNESTVRAALDPYAQYVKLFDDCKDFYEGSGQNSKGATKSIEDLIYVQNVNMYELAFEQQYHYGVVYAWTRLREQEIRNLEWIANMIVLNRRDHIDEYVPIFKPRA